MSKSVEETRTQAEQLHGYRKLTNAFYHAGKGEAGEVMLAAQRVLGEEMDSETFWLALEMDRWEGVDRGEMFDARMEEWVDVAYRPMALAA